MKKKISLAFLVVSLLTSQGVYAACSKATIRGNFGTVGTVTATDGIDILSVHLMGRTNFNGSGQVKITNGKVSAFGGLQSISAIGTYNLGANCVGTASLTIRSAGSVIGKMRLDMVVSGTAQAPQIAVVYTSTSDQESGQFTLNKIRI